MRVLVIAQSQNSTVDPSTYSVISAATQLTSETDILVLGANCFKVAESLKKRVGVSQIRVVDNPNLATRTVESYSSIVEAIAAEYDAILTASTSFGKTLMPYVAGKLGLGQVSDCLQIINHDTFVRGIYAGSFLETIRSHASKKLITIRATAFEAAGLRSDGGEAQVHIEQIPAIIPRVQVKELRNQVTKRPDLTVATIVVSGGRGIGSRENFQKLEHFADALGAAVGASRAAVDAGFVSNEHQVGQTGKVVAPTLYLAFGISGATQHIAGIMGSKIIVAVNKDPKAPIFEVANYGLVADWATVVDEWEK